MVHLCPRNAARGGGRLPRADKPKTTRKIRETGPGLRECERSREGQRRQSAWGPRRTGPRPRSGGRPWLSPPAGFASSHVSLHPAPELGTTTSREPILQTRGACRARRSGRRRRPHGLWKHFRVPARPIEPPRLVRKPASVPRGKGRAVDAGEGGPSLLGERVWLLVSRRFRVPAFANKGT